MHISISTSTGSHAFSTNSETLCFLSHAGIKVALPCESASGRCFLQLYIESILALQVRAVTTGHHNNNMQCTAVTHAWLPRSVSTSVLHRACL
jgi:hypothetical protein